MAHSQQANFCMSVRDAFPKYFSEVLVLDVGSLDINGNNQFLFADDCLYLGVDIAAGKNVDIVTPGHLLNLPPATFDVIISTECLEHDRFYIQTLRNIERLLKPGGLFLMSCATTGRPEHGTLRTTPSDAPLLRLVDDEWANYYKNLTESDIRSAIDVDSVFSEYRFSIGDETHDLYFYGIKCGKHQSRCGASWLLDSSPRHVKIESLRGELDTAEAANAKLRGELDAAQVQALSARKILAQTQQALEQTQQERYALYTSTSWRVTAPMRFLSRRVMGLRSGRAIRVTQNVGRALRGEFRWHGFLGILRRIPYYTRRRELVISLLFGKTAQGQAHWSFQASPMISRPLRLHPDLAGEAQPIAATVSVVIPTLNPGPEFSMLLRKLREQQGLSDVEVVIVDSGSTDGSVDVARQWDCTVVEIAPLEFSHSGARNLGAAHAKGDYLLFMVQDAYPIGEHWMYGMLRYLLDHAEQNLVAVSCAETPRSDSDMMYDSMIDTHYRFLGCHDQDRLGRLHGTGHMALRSQGQLSDVACLIRRQEFEHYRYRGDYAEDLDLGMRIIRDGKAVAMLASVKVIHSHNRPAFYYLKRSFVDVVFLVGMFDDFPLPPTRSVAGLIDAIHRVAQHLSIWLQSQSAASVEGAALGDVLQRWVKAWRSTLLTTPAPATNPCLGDQGLESALASLLQRVDMIPGRQIGADEQDAQQFVDMFLGRVEHLGRFASGVYGRLDSRLSNELIQAVIKIFAAAAGSALGFAYVQLQDGPQPEADLVRSVFLDLRAGV